MGRLNPFRGKHLLLLLSLLLVLAGIGWWQRTPVLAWYYVRGLSGASEVDRETWVTRVTGLDSAAVPALLACLRRDNPQACANAQTVLVHLVARWGACDARALELADKMTESFPGLSGCGQQNALALAVVLFKGLTPSDRPPSTTLAAGRMLAAAAQGTESGLHARALALAEVLVEGATPGPWRESLHGLVSTGLKNPDSDTRVRAVHLTLHESLREDSDLRAQVVPLLHDPEAPVRRAAVLGVGMAEQTVGEDELLPLLHDADADVCRLCEGALRGRGLREDHLKLARLISDPRPSARLEVVDYLLDITDLEPGAWLRRLSQDSSPAVRAAAVRAAAAQTQVDLSDRLREVAQNDSSPTVRQLAGHYYQQHRQALAGH